MVVGSKLYASSRRSSGLSAFRVQTGLRHWRLRRIQFNSAILQTRWGITESLVHPASCSSFRAAISGVHDSLAVEDLFVCQALVRVSRFPVAARDIFSFLLKVFGRNLWEMFSIAFYLGEAFSRSSAPSFFLAQEFKSPIGTVSISVPFACALFYASLRRDAEYSRESSNTVSLKCLSSTHYWFDLP